LLTWHTSLGSRSSRECRNSQLQYPGDVQYQLDTLGRQRAIDYVPDWPHGRFHFSARNQAQRCILHHRGVVVKNTPRWSMECVILTAENNTNFGRPILQRLQYLVPYAEHRICWHINFRNACKYKYSTLIALVLRISITSSSGVTSYWHTRSQDETRFLL